MLIKLQLRFLPPANEVWGKVIFLHLFVILFTGGSAYTPWSRHPSPRDQGPGTPPGSRHPLQTKYTPQTRYTSLEQTPFQDQVHPPGPGPPPDQVHPPEQSILGDTVNVRAVRILLECNLVPYVNRSRIVWTSLSETRKILGVGPHSLLIFLIWFSFHHNSITLKSMFEVITRHKEIFQIALCLIN